MRSPLLLVRDCYRSFLYTLEMLLLVAMVVDYLKDLVPDLLLVVAYVSHWVVCHLS